MPSVIPEMYSTASVKQQPLGTLIVAGLVTLLNCSAAAGVDIALLVSLGSPFTTIATTIGVTVLPSVIAILPL